MDNYFWAFRWAFVALFAAVLAPAAQAQTFNNPSYIPTFTQPAQVCTAACDVVVQLQSAGTAYFEVTGSGTGLAGVFQASGDRAASPTWTQINAVKAGSTGGGGITNTMSATGLYRVSVAGAAQVRLHLTAVTGSISIAASQGLGVHDATTLPRSRQTYSAAALIGTGATTHFLSIAGSATTTVRITHVECSGFATAALSERITAEIDSTADTVDAGTTMTAVPQDSTNAAATAIAKYHTTSPTSGALVGYVRAGNLNLSNAATVFGNILAWDFGGVRPGEQEIVLRGTLQSFSLNTSAAFGSGGSVGCSVTWTEE
jgi:hypothetical protein